LTNTVVLFGDLFGAISFIANALSCDPVKQ